MRQGRLAGKDRKVCIIIPQHTRYMQCCEVFSYCFNITATAIGISVFIINAIFAA